MATIEICDNQEVIKGILVDMKRKSIINYAGVSLLFNGKIMNGKIDGYFSPNDNLHSKTLNHFDPFSGVTVEGRYNLVDGIIRIKIKPAFLFYFSMLMPMVGFSIAVYAVFTGIFYPKFYIGIGFGIVTSIALLIYYKMIKSKIIKYMHGIHKTSKRNFDKMN